MNIKNIMKTMCAALACSTLLSNLIPVYAIEEVITESPMDESVGSGADWTADEGSLEEIEVIYRQASSYNVTIPKTITLGQSKQATYSVKVTGDIDANERVHVVPVDGISGTEGVDFYMKDQTAGSKNADVVATVTQSKFYWNSEEVANGYEETSNFVSAPNLTAGTWKGTFQVAINLETMAHVHNYVDGKCTECGEVDPNHEHNYVDGICGVCGDIDPNHLHNYVDGTCTICGKDDTYEIAPESEYLDWNYVLDEENRIIFLKYYKGTQPDVIVYSSFEIAGIVYKTELSNGGLNGGANNIFGSGAGRASIKTIKFSDCLDTSNLNNMSDMFAKCSSLISIDFGDSFDTSKVEYMNDMFKDCTALTSLDLSNFDTSNVREMKHTFYKCSSLTRIDFGDSFDTSKVEYMQSMFSNCSALTELDLSNFNTKNVKDMEYMFSMCGALKNIYVSNLWTTSNASTSGMFGYCGVNSVTYK